MDRAAPGRGAVERPAAVQLVAEAGHGIHGLPVRLGGFVAARPLDEGRMAAQAGDVPPNGLQQFLPGLLLVAVPAGRPFLHNHQPQPVTQVVEIVALRDPAAPGAQQLHVLLLGQGEEPLRPLPRAAEQRVGGAPVDPFDKQGLAVDDEGPVVPVFAGPLRQRGHLDGAQAEGDRRLCLAPPASIRPEAHTGRDHRGRSATRDGDRGWTPACAEALRPPPRGRRNSPPRNSRLDDAGEHRVPLACHGQADVRQPRLRIPGRHKRPLQAESRPALQPHGIPDAPGGDAGVMPAVDAVDDHAVFQPSS